MLALIINNRKANARASAIATVTRRNKGINIKANNNRECRQESQISSGTDDLDTKPMPLEIPNTIYRQS